MKNKRRREQVAYQQYKKRRQDTKNDASDIDLENASSDSGSEENYFKDGQFQFDDNVEEVLPITNEDDESDEQQDEEGSEQDGDSDDDLEEHDQNKNLEAGSSSSEDEEDADNLHAWENKKKNFFNADFVDEDRGQTYRDDDKEMAQAEEDAALAIHRDFLNDIYPAGSGIALDDEFLMDEASPIAEDKLEPTGPDWKVIDKKVKLRLVKKQSPEFMPTMICFREKLRDLTYRMLPLVRHLRKTDVSEGPYTKYVDLKTQLLLQYCMNASFYMYLKASHIPATRHPVLKRLEQYKNLLNRLQCLDEKLNPLIDEMLKNIERNNAVSNELSSIFCSKEQTVPIVSKKNSQDLNVKCAKNVRKLKGKKQVHFETDVEKEVLSGYMDRKEQERKLSTLDDSDQLDDEEEIEGNDEENAEDAADAKRSITYQIAKNKGMIPQRKKEYRNPRVRHRMKFKKAQIRRKGQVRLPRKELKKYSGEMSGISTHVIKSIKFK